MDTIILRDTKYGSSLVFEVYYVVSDETSCNAIETAGEFEIYEVNNVKHYIMINDETNVAAWFNGQVQCVIQSNLEKRVMEKIIK